MQSAASGSLNILDHMPIRQRVSAPALNPIVIQTSAYSMSIVKVKQIRQTIYFPRRCDFI